ncbi:MAG: type II toxin-antitoxin system Phd/YefM family antitoxin [Candidatus Sulfotelmatobacter sp.]
MEVDLHEARAHFSRLLKRVALGEQVVITKAGTAVAKLVPINPKKRKFRLGSARGEFVVPEDFNEPDPELEDLFYQPLPE